MVVMLFLLGLGVFGLMSLSPGDIVDNYARSQILQTRGFQSNTNTLTEDQIKEAKHRLVAGSALLRAVRALAAPGLR